MFARRERRRHADVTVDLAFTDRWGGVASGEYATLDLTLARSGDEAALEANRTLLANAFDVDALAMMRQVHGGEVQVVRSIDAAPPICDGLVTAAEGVALCVRVGDCAPVVLADVVAGVVGVAHVGRPGLTNGIVATTVATMRELGATAIEAWVGPLVCAGCYEVPADLREAVAEVEPAAFSCTTWGTPSVDIRAVVDAQLRLAGCAVDHLEVCTRESDDFFSYRRQGRASGRQGALVVVRRDAAESRT